MSASLRETTFILTNLGIFGGYSFLSSLVIPHMRVRLWRTKIGGVFFFLTCGFTHLELALHTYFDGEISHESLLSWHMVIAHSIQVVAVWAFVTGLYIEFVRDGYWPKSVVRRKGEEPEDDE